MHQSARCFRTARPGARCGVLARPVSGFIIECRLEGDSIPGSVETQMLVYTHFRIWQQFCMILCILRQ
eukprot:672346-Pyramimonas_sp.AAC.1